MLPVTFFDQPANALAANLVGRDLRRHITHPELGSIRLTVRIVETEAYFMTERGSHSSLGETASRRAMFAPPGTIYMYYARGGDSLNFSARGPGDAVLIKAGVPVADSSNKGRDIELMQTINPGAKGARPERQLCRGQTLLCRSLALRVPEWNGRLPDSDAFHLAAGSPPDEILVCRRLGIPAGRDEHLHLRFVDAGLSRYATRNPVTARTVGSGSDYLRCTLSEAVSRTRPAFG